MLGCLGDGDFLFEHEFDQLFSLLNGRRRILREILA